MFRIEQNNNLGNVSVNEQSTLFKKRTRFEEQALPAPKALLSAPALNFLDGKSFTDLTALEEQSLGVQFQDNGEVAIAQVKADQSEENELPLQRVFQVIPSLINHLQRYEQNGHVIDHVEQSRSAGQVLDGGAAAASVNDPSAQNDLPLPRIAPVTSPLVNENEQEVLLNWLDQNDDDNAEDPVIYLGLPPSEAASNDSSSLEAYAAVSMEEEDQAARVKYWIFQGKQAEVAGNLQQALNFYGCVLNIDSNAIEPLHALAEIAFKVGAFRESVKYDLKAIELSGRYVAPYLRLAEVAKAEGSYSMASQFLAKVFELDPSVAINSVMK